MADAPIEVPVGFQDAMAKVDAAKPSQADISSALPEEFAVEVTGIRGEKRIDYKGVPLRNADGTLNKSGKNLLDLHAPAARAGADVSAKLTAGDYADTPEQAAERERKRPLAPDVAARVAQRRGLEPVRGERFRGRHVRDESGHPNLWKDRETGRLYRMALVGNERTARVETYSA